MPSAILDEPWRPFTLERQDRILVAAFGGERELLSWAIWRGGRRRARAVAWVEVQNAELPLGVDPRALIGQRLSQAELTAAVGFLTSRRLDRFQEAEAEHPEIRARALATVGLSNAVRVGDPPGRLSAAGSVGTINILCEVSRPLSEEAALEALSLVVEARTTAVLEAGLPSRRGGEPCTGTGTDCVALAWPPPAEEASEYAGKHTPLGHVVGRSVLEAVRAGVQAWLEENRWPRG